MYSELLLFPKVYDRYQADIKVELKGPLPDQKRSDGSMTHQIWLPIIYMESLLNNCSYEYWCPFKFVHMNGIRWKLEY